jgi:hypothetical protein
MFKQHIDMLKYSPKIREEELKNNVADDLFYDRLEPKVYEYGFLKA